MPVIWIPALLRDLTDGKERVTVPGRTLRQAIDELEAHHPGLKARLLEENQLRLEFSVVVDGTVSQRGASLVCHQRGIISH
jgi:molybdopterin converting factor small subunit